MSHSLFHGRTSQKSLPDIVPLFELEGALLLPRAHLPVHIQESKYKSLVESVLGGNRLVGFVQPRCQSENILFDAGCLGRISTFSESSEGGYFIIVKGVIRFQIQELFDEGGVYRSARVDYQRYLLDLHETTEPIEGRERLINLLQNFLKHNDLLSNWNEIAESSDENLVSLLAMICPFGPQEKQAILETHTLKDRSRMIAALMEMSALPDCTKTWRVH